MFKFGFDVEEEEDSDLQLNLPGPSSGSQPATEVSGGSKGDEKCYHVTLEELMESLPENISYSPISVPGLHTPLLRRDLFDARFQLYSRDDEKLAKIEGDETDNGAQKRTDEDGEEYVDSSTDLVPGLYEGGLKTWEGGVDLVEVLNGVEVVGDWLSGSSVLEVGCGTSLPTAFLLSSLFSTSTESSGPSGAKTILHLQDYNKPVLSLVSLPNLFLALLPHFPPEILHDSDDADDNDVEDVLSDLSKPGVLALTAKVKDHFKALLVQRGIELRFTYGHWGGMARDLHAKAEKYDLVLTSETIYSEESVDDLLAVLRAANGGKGKEGARPVEKVEVGLEESLGELKLGNWRRGSLKEHDGVVLVAAKVLYFGVGGGLQDFQRRVEKDEGWWEGVKDWVVGVGRKVVRIGW